MNRILIAAHSLLRMTLWEFLEKHGYSVEIAEDGVKALLKLEHERFDLVITEFGLFRMTGLDLIKCMQRRDSYKDVPTIVLILPWESSAKDLIHHQGVFGALTAPYKQEELLSIIGEALAGQSIRQNGDSHK